MMRLRKIWVEGSFAAMKREHCLSRIRKRGIPAATEECLLSAMTLNLKRMVKAAFSELIFLKNAVEAYLLAVSPFLAAGLVKWAN